MYCGEKLWRSKNREICKGQARAAKEAGSGYICSHASALGNCLRLSARSTHAVAVDRHRAFIAILSLPSTTTISPSSSSTMASTSNSTWVPTGRHKVQVGTSLGKALKARKGAVPPKRSNLPERQFYSFRCMSSLLLPSQLAWGLRVLGRSAANFKPESIDSTRPGTIQVQKNDTVRVERPTQAVCFQSSPHLFERHTDPLSLPLLPAPP